jgi:hypothetical protein
LVVALAELLRGVTDELLFVIAVVLGCESLRANRACEWEGRVVGIEIAGKVR